MNHDSYNDAYIRGILDSVNTVAIIGASANPIRPSYFVLTYLVAKGYDVIAVNPGQAGKTIAGAPVVASLLDISRPVDMVDIFRNSEVAGTVVDDALAMLPQPRIIWMQLQVRNDEAAARAEAAGIKVVMNRCPKIEYARLCGEIGWAGVNSKVISARKPKLQHGYQHFTIGRNTGSDG